MNLEDIKVGDVYNVRVRVVDVDDDTGEITTETANENGYALGFEWCYYAPGEALAFSPISTENGIKNTEPAPKYDPCRLFRKGDKVRVVEWKGRNYTDRDHGTELNTGCFAEIWEDEKDEQEEGYVAVTFEEYIRYVPPCYLELVTPVEEIKPYSVHETDYLYRVMQSVDGGEQVVCEYRKNTHPHAKEAAEAECDRLNAKYRKEQV